MLRAVAFDLWETLITQTPESARVQKALRHDRLSSVFAVRGIEVTPDALQRALQKSWHRCWELYWADDRDCPTVQQVVHFLEFLELGDRLADVRLLEELEESYAGVALDSPPEVVAHAGETLRWIKSQHLRVGLISNTGRTPGTILREILDRAGLGAFIDAMVFSNEHGECKPRESIFTTLRAHLGVECDEMVFVGDNLYVDIYGAQRCGIRAVHFDPETRGVAVAPHVDHDHEIVPDATIRSLAELPGVIASFRA